MNKDEISFLLGSIILDSFKKKSPIYMIINLYSLYKERKNFIRQKKIGYRDSLQLNGVYTKNNILSYSEDIGAKEGWVEALSFSLKHSNKKYVPGISLVAANAFLEDDVNWLSSVNKYLSFYGLDEIALARGSSDKFFRFESTSNKYKDHCDKVSIIICAFNSEKTLKKAVYSILQQTWRNIEVIIADDASTDSTWTIVNQLKEEDSRIKIFKNKNNVGPYATKNLALKIATGTYVTGHDADDWSHPQRIERDLNVIKSSNNIIKCVVSRYIKMNKEGLFGKFSSLSELSDGVSSTSPISLLFDNAWFKKNVGFWDSVRFSADSEILNRIEEISKDSIFYSKNISMVCLDIETSLTNSREAGISKGNGLSEIRKNYKKAFQSWHESADDLYMEFPLNQRKFKAPENMVVNYNSVVENLNFFENK